MKNYSHAGKNDYLLQIQILRDVSLKLQREIASVSNF